MIEKLLPSSVIAVAAWGDEPDAVLFPEEAAQLGRTASARAREFATGRHCARLALSKLGFHSTLILRGPSGEPLWPGGVVGSITHCRGYRAAAVALRREVLAVGIDAEIHEELPLDVLELVAAREKALLPSAPRGIHWDRLLFSAKESTFKAWFPVTGRWLDFEDIIVTFEPVGQTFHAELRVVAATVSGRSLAGFEGRYLVQDGMIFTAIAVTDGPP